MSTASQKLPKEKVVVEEEDRDDDSLSAEPPTDSVSPENNKRAWEHALHNKRSLSTLQFQYDVNFQDEAGTSLLHLSAFNGNTANVTFLLSKGALVDITDKCGSTPLHVAASFNSDKVLDMLISKHADVNKKVNRLYYFTNRKDAYFRYMDMMCDMTEGFTPLHCAAAVWSPNCIQSLLKSRANIEIGDVEGRTPLFKLGSINFDETSEERYLQVLRDFQSRRAKFSRDGYNCLKLATCKNWSAAVHWLLLQNAKLTDVLYGGTNDETILHVAVSEAKPEIVGLLLTDRQCNQIVNNFRNTPKETALWQAVNAGSEACAQKLLDNGANYKTPFLLHQIVLKNMFDLLSEVMSLDMQWCHVQSVVKSSDHEGMTCFHLAAQLPDDNCLTSLFECHIKSQFCEILTQDILNIILLKTLEVEDNFGRTPLHCAANSRSRPCIEYLIKKGANIGAKTYFNQSAMQLMVRNIANGIEFIDDLFDRCVTIVEIDDLIAANLLGNITEGALGTPGIESKYWLVVNFRIFFANKQTQLSILQTLFEGVQHPKERILLTHPLVECFLYLKWKKIQMFWAMYLSIYAMYVATISGLFLVSDRGDTVLVTCLRQFLLICCVILLILRLPQVILAYGETLFQLKPILMMLPLVLGMQVSFIDLSDKASESDKTTASLGVLLAWFAFISQTAKIPEYGKHHYMFLEIVKVLLRFAIFCVCVFIGYGIGIVSIMRDQYHSVVEGMVEILCLWLGAVDYDPVTHTPNYDYFKPGDKYYAPPQLHRIPGLSEFMILTYILIGVVSLMNFIIGLTITNVEIIEKDGSFWQYKGHVEFLWHIEKCLSCIKLKWFKQMLKKNSIRATEIFKMTSIEKELPYALSHSLLDVAAAAKGNGRFSVGLPKMVGRQSTNK